MGRLIHPTAAIDSSVELDSGVRVGAYAVLEGKVEVGRDSEIGAAAQIQGPTRIGRENRIFPHACVGFDPQDLKYGGEETFLEIGDRNSLREFSTYNRGTVFGGRATSIGDDNLFMAYCHVGHDCQIGSRIVLTNATTLAGHVEVQDDATISAFTSVSPFRRIGRHAYIGGYSVITMDALPFSITVGQKPAWYGLNRIGLERKGYSPTQIEELESALRTLLRSGMNLGDAVASLRSLETKSADVDYLIEFVASSEHGVIKAARRGSRGADASD